MARRGDLERRLLDILDPHRTRSTPSRRQAAALVGALALIAIVVGATAPTVAAAPIVVHDTPSAPPIAPQVTSTSARSVERITSVAPTRAGGTWAIRLAEPAEGGTVASAAAGAPVVHVALRTPGLNTFYISLARLEGLTTDRIASSDSATFRLQRDAGTFTFGGRFVNGRGRGSFDFTPDAAYADALAGRGVGRPTAEQHFSLALHGLDLAFVDELAAQGYAPPAMEALVRASMSSADIEYLREMGALGYRLGTLPALVRLSDHSLTVERIRTMNARAGRQLSSDELLAAAMQGGADEPRSRERPAEAVPPRFRERPEEASDQRSRERTVEMPSTGARYAESRSATSSSPRTTPLEGRWVIDRPQAGAVDLELFWTDSTNWKRRIATSAFRGITADAMLAPASGPATFRIEQDAGTLEFTGVFRSGEGSGFFRFTPEREFASTLRALGVVGADDVTDHDLKNLTWGGVSGADIQEFQAIGFTPLMLRDAVGLAIRFVTPDYVRAMQAAGVAEARTIRGIENLRMAGVTAEYVRELAALGYTGLSGAQLGYLRRAGVTPALVRELHAAGVRGLTVDELIRRARGGRESRVIR